MSMLVDQRVSLDTLPEKWFNADFGENFKESCRVFEDCRDTQSGCVYLPSPHLGDRRVLHWTATEGVVCLKDVRIRSALENNSVIIHLGSSAILQIRVESLLQDTTLSVTIAIVQQDGNIHRLHLSAGDNVSLLESLVLSGEGRIVHLGGILTSEIPSMRLSTARQRKVGNTSAATLTVDFGLVQSVPADRDVLCAAWVSCDLLVLGLSHGDVLVVQLQVEQRESGLVVGKQLRLREHLLKDRGGGLQALWSDLLGRGTVTDANSDTIAVGAQSASVLAINRSGKLRLWSAQSKQLVAYTFLYDLLDAAGALGSLLPHSSGNRNGASTQSEKDKNIHLQECIVRLDQDALSEGEAYGGARCVLGALAVLPESAALSTAGTWGLVPESHSALRQPMWQIYLVAWRENHGAAASAVATAEKPKLISQPVHFPVEEAVAGEQGPLAFKYCSASLQDVQLVIDSAGGTATLLTVWRAEATRTNAEGEVERIVLNGLVGRSVLTLTGLRAQAFFATSEAASAGPTPLSELQAWSEMVLVAQSPLYDELRWREEDVVLRRLRNARWINSAAADLDLLVLEEKKLKAEMLQRIFLRRRFSRQAICVAYNAYSDKLCAAKDQMVEDTLLMDWRDADVDGLPMNSTHRQQQQHHRHLHPDQLTSLTELPSLVLDLCESAASLKLAEDTGKLVASLGGTERDGKRRTQHLHHLEFSFVAFVEECENATARFSRLQAGCLAAVVRGGVVLAAVAHRGGDLSLIQDSENAPLKEEEEVVLPPTDATKQAHALLCQLEAQYSSSPSLASAFLELDCLLSAFIEEGDLSATGALWIEQYFAALSPVLRDLVPRLAGLLSSVTASRYSCFDALLAFDESHILRSFVERAFKKLDSAVVPIDLQQGVCDEHAAAALVQELSYLLRQRLRKVKLVLGLLFLLKDVGQALLSGDVYAAIRDVYIPKATHVLVHYSLLLWLDTRLPTDNHMLRYDVELAGIFPLSAVLAPSSSNNNSADTATAAQACAGASVTQVNARLSVLENFATHFCAHHGRICVDSVLPALLPSVHSELAVYLFQSGQYVASGKWAALARLGSTVGEFVNVGYEAADDGALTRMVPVLSDMRTRATQLTAEYYELLRRQWLALQCAGSGLGGGTQLLAALRFTGLELLNVTQRLGALAADLMQEDCYFTESALSSPSRPSHKDGPGSSHEVFAALQEKLQSTWQERSYLVTHRACTVAEICATGNFVDGLLSLTDAVQYVGASYNNSSFASGLIRNLEDGDDQLCAAKLLQEQASELCTSLHLSGLSSVLEIIDRSLPLLPREDGACLALEGALRYVEQLNVSLDVLAQSNNAKSTACTETLVVDLHGAWSRVFEYALWHGDRFGEALEALLRVAELEEQRLALTPGAVPATGVTWRDCLRTLVTQACETGHLGWLCSVPDRQLLGYARRGLSVSDAVAATLEVLATTLETSSANDVNYFECLHVYLLSRRNYYDAARIMHRFVEGSSLPHKDHSSAGHIAAALTALTVLPSDQAFLLHRAGTATSNASSSSDRLLPAAPVRQLDVEQLYLAFAREITAAKLRFVGVSATGAGLQNVLALSNSCHLHASLSLAAMEDRANSAAAATAELPLVDVAVMALTKLCVAPPSLSSSNVFCQARVDAFLYAPYALPCRPVATAPASGRDDETAECWHALDRLLRCLGRDGGEPSTRRYEAAVRALLAFHSSDSMEGSSAQLQLPRALIDAFSGFRSLSDTAINLAGRGDAGSLIRLLVEFEHLEDACLLAARMVLECNTMLGSSAAHQPPKTTCLPYTLFDLLIAHCQQHLPRLQISAGGDALRLKTAYKTLTSSLEQHFAIMVLS